MRQYGPGYKFPLPRMKKKFLFFVASSLLFSAFAFWVPIQKIGVDMIAKSVHNGKSVSAKAEVYYQTSGGLMVTHFTSPFEQIVITNSKGEFKNYDVKKNTLMQSQGLDYSSKNSFFYFFLSGKTQDLGLTTFGYTLTDTRIDNEMVITTWKPPSDAVSTIKKVEIVHENQIPVFMGFFDSEGKPAQKIFYSNYQNVQNIRMPMNITEFQYLSDGDSIVSRRSYSNIRINESVENTYLNFKIPADARLVKQVEEK